MDSNTLEQIFAFGLAGASILISLLDFAGLLPFLAGRTSTLSLLVIGSAVGYLALQRRSKLDKIEEAVTQGFEKILSSLVGGQVKRFDDVKDMWEYSARRIKEAHRCVDDLTWGDLLTSRRTRAQEAAFQQYLSAIAYTSKRGTGVDFREVMTFPSPSRFERAERFGAQDYYGFQLKYFDIDHKLFPPLIQFTVIDSEELIFTFHRGRYHPSEPEIRLATRQKEFVQLFQDYFNAIWNCEGAKVVKATGEPANLQALQYIRQQYPSTPRP